VAAGSQGEEGSRCSGNKERLLQVVGWLGQSREPSRKSCGSRQKRKGAATGGQQCWGAVTATLAAVLRSAFRAVTASITAGFEAVLKADKVCS